MTAYYNEIEPFAAQWLRNLINAGHIAPGIVDERSIEDVYPSDLRGFTQCHFFAGIGVWSHALRSAGWSDDRPVWTGSCPCQPFSAAGKGAGFDDERHLWPAFHHLIKECRPAIIIGEQVASKDSDPWIDLVHADLEAMGYAFGAVPFPSAGIGAPHIRDRLYWLADSANQRRDGWRASQTGNGGIQARVESQRFCDADRLDNADDAGLEGLGSGYQTQGGQPGQVRPITATSELGGMEHAPSNGWEQWGTESGQGSITAGCPPSGLADTLDSTGHGSQPRGAIRELSQGVGALQTECRPTGPVNGRWSDADWLFCRDGKWRPVEPGSFPLAHGAPARVGRLRAYGNAINAKAAQAFIECVMDCTPTR